MKKLHIYLASDSTGETVKALSRACIALFPGNDYQEHNYVFVRTENRIKEILAKAEEEPGIILFTFVNLELQNTLLEGARAKNIPVIPVLNPFLDFLSSYFHINPVEKAGLQHSMDEAYFQRIEAMDFTLRHDDGQNIDDLEDADVVLIGVSRTSKTPTCIYLANRGIKAVNIPFIRDLPVDERVKSCLIRKKPLFFGLVKDVSYLIEIRKNRLLTIKDRHNKEYIDYEKIEEETRQAKRFFSEYGIRMIDVTRRSIEEVSTEIIAILEKTAPSTLEADKAKE